MSGNKTLWRARWQSYFAVKKEFGNVVKAATDWHAGDFFGEETVFAGITVKNTGTKPMFFHYYMAIYEKALGKGS